ncbi:Histone acetyltransferase HPA2-like protein [Ignavibacterium album JCM 16511]|uniref:Histone acetyltransferase HPA2-like protein n=1 Tax=Ignavibacterium album (strain DSM 19864 / JCM 16511 / NBRC 101810 / Mat9-16) TaxID=945713 RepID=I0AI59_IGNAJ|nr:GNAT family N-acetyltransferase [Ignavibacterium album]AFH48666.1 Histone acetyltransferase HPA2-like protein [Ignavibacterium album JCM 16511]
MTNEELKIRKAEKSDIPNILKLIKELAEYEKLLHEVVTTEKNLEEVIFGEKKFVEVLIAEFNGELAGQTIFFHNFSTFVGKPGLYIEDLYVRPQFRGKGIGKALLNEVIKLAKERNCGRVEWVVLDWNQPAIDFYKSIGAKAMDEWTIFRLTENKF